MRLMFLMAALLMVSACGTQLGRKECLYSRPVTTQQSYCAKQAQPTCSSYCDNYGCRTNCIGGGYCEQTSYRTVTVNQCQQYACKAGYISANGGCYTQAELDARAENARERAINRARNANDSGASLAVIGYNYEYGENDYVADLTTARTLYEEACGLGSGYGCNRMGLYYQGGRVVTQDYARAIGYFERSCGVGDPYGCYNAARYYDDIAPSGPDHVKAAVNYRQACDQGHTRGCGYLAIKTYNGQGVAADRAAARRIINNAVSVNAADLQAEPDSETYQKRDAWLKATRANIYRADLPSPATQYQSGDYVGALRVGLERLAAIEQGVREGVLPRTDAGVERGNVSWYALFTRDFALAEREGRRGVEIAPDTVFIAAHLAHALMLQGKTAEADALYDRHRGAILPTHENIPWEQMVLGDFDALTAAGITHPHMAVVRARLGG